DPAELATPEGFVRNPALVWRWYQERRAMIARAQPHAGHRAIAELETLYSPFLLLTQNIDNLHRAAGSTRLIELHGNIFRYKCFDQHHPVEQLPGSDEVPPRCACGSLIRPDVVWFGELPRHLEDGYCALATCAAILVVGTSGIVYPAAGFPGVAKQVGARVVEVNPEETPITAIADVFVHARAGEALPALVAAIRERRSGA
ncbi:MAG: NAD-dependent protein deacylase, partial [Candidatus Krumholzibacteria bacterium]|nr:NAD-dependent protein deacylase [Candidatus Krumholzibacteria bacterium]